MFEKWVKSSFSFATIDEDSENCCIHVPSLHEIQNLPDSRFKIKEKIYIDRAGELESLILNISKRFIDEIEDSHHG